jgi:hypothetical protein
VRPRRQRAALTGDDASIEIELRQLAGEHEWELGKRIRGSVEAIGGQRRLPTVVRGLSERGSGGGWVQGPGCAQLRKKRGNCYL